MARLPTIRRFAMEDFQEEKSWIHKLLLPLNEFLQNVVNALSNNLTFRENLSAQIQTIRIRTGANPSLATSKAQDEYVEASVTSYTNVPGATTVWGNLTSISLSPGTWDITGTMNWIANGATVTTGIDLHELAISVNSGATTTDHVQGTNQFNVLVPSASTDRFGFVPNYRISVSTATTVYFKLLSTYTVATPQYKCHLSARRVSGRSAYIGLQDDISFKSTTKNKPICLWVGDCKEVATNPAVINYGVSAYWSYNNGQVTVSAVSGLDVSKEYDVTLVLITG